MKSKNNSFLLPLVFALALALRLAGITHGFPFIFHPDEPAVVRTALELRFFPNPGHFDWPHMFMYINYIVYMAFAQVRGLIDYFSMRPTFENFFPLMWDDSLVFYFISRVLSAVLGAATVIPIYLIGRDNFGKRVGILSALVFAVLPFHVWHSHYALIDSPMLFFAAFAVFYITNILKIPEINDYAGAGFYTGLAASTKYNGALTLLLIPFAHIFRVIRNREKPFTTSSFMNLSVALFTSAIGFLMGTPYALLDFQTFIRTDGPKGALWQFTNVGSLPFMQRFPEFVHEMIFKLADDTGYTVLAGFFVVFLILLFRYFTKKSTPENYMVWFFFISGLFMLFYVSGVANSRSHYYFIAYPYIVVLFAYLLDLIIKQFYGHFKPIGFVLFILLLSFPVVMSLKNAFTFSQSDTRVALYSWMQKNISNSDTIYFNKNLFSPVLDKFTNSKKRIDPRNPLDLKGYVILAYEPACDCTDFATSMYGNSLHKVLDISPELKLGPHIVVYSINKGF